MAVLFWITVGIGGVWILLFLMGLAEHLQTIRLRPPKDEDTSDLPRVSIIVPARNEENNIGPCLETLVAQTHKDIEIIVVDDNSTDKTGEVIDQAAEKDPRIKPIHLTELPAGWTGKCNAMNQAILQGKPTGEWLLFTDADTLHNPGSVSTGLRFAQKKQVDFLTLVPHLGAHSFWEKLMQPTMFALIAVFNKPKAINDPNRPEAFANGQFMLVKREAYQKSGGHDAVCGKILDDSELARSMVRAGYRMFVAQGRDLFTTRMYMSLSDLIEGWTKNFYMILEKRVAKVFLAAFVALLFSMWPAVFGWLSVFGLFLSLDFWPDAWMLAGAGIYLEVLAFQFSLRGLNGWYAHYAPFAPLGNLVAVFILSRSAWRNARGRGVSWKGRDVVDQQDQT